MLKNKLLVLLIVSSLNVFIFAQSASYFDTRTEQGMEKSLIIVGYTGKDRKVNIPSYIDGIPVRKIGSAAFKLKGLSEVIIPDGIVAIGDHAFYGNQMSSVSIPASVISIGNSAFDSNILTTIVSKKGGIHNSANNQQTSTLTQARVLPSKTQISHNIPNIPDKILGTGIIQDERYDPMAGASAYYKQRTAVKPEKEAASSATVKSSQAHVETPKSNNNNPPAAETVKGNYTGVIGNSAYTGRGRSNLVIPEGTTYIGDGAFTSNNLTSITIPNSVRVIGSQAFMGNNLTAITIGEGVKVQPDSFRYQFSDYYRMNKYKAGTYLLKTGHWNYEGQEIRSKFLNSK
jgi:hypothetical protein